MLTANFLSIPTCYLISILEQQQRQAHRNNEFHISVTLKKKSVFKLINGVTVQMLPKYMSIPIKNNLLDITASCLQADNNYV